MDHLCDRSRNSCLIERVDAQGNVMQMGLTEIRAIVIKLDGSLKAIDVARDCFTGLDR